MNFGVKIRHNTRRPPGDITGDMRRSLPPAPLLAAAAAGCGLQPQAGDSESRSEVMAPVMARIDSEVQPCNLKLDSKFHAVP